MKKVLILMFVAFLILSVTGCGPAGKKESKMSITKVDWGTADGKPVYLWTLTNKNGLVAKITNYGGIVTELWLPDKTGKMADCVLGFDNLADYIKPGNSPYFGALIGRYGNRIGGAKFTLEGRTYTLAANDNQVNHLHGGVKGYDKVVWNGKDIKNKNGVGLELTYLSKDGDEGYPGNLNVKVVYMLTNKNELTMEYWATTDKPTVANLTQHNYYNLGGQDSGAILGELMMINGDKFTPTDSKLIPTGEILPVAGTPMDFKKPTAIGARIGVDYEPLKFAGGYDHNWILNKEKSDAMTLAAKVVCPKSGRVMEVWTNEPAIQFYSGNFLNGTIAGKGGVKYVKNSALCLETQHYPDSPNKPSFPSTELKPGQEYHTKTINLFKTE
jgi:aldose 1-epimerase